MTNGCKWQEKSFSVMLMDNPTVLCKCGKEAGLYKHNGENLCRKCFMSLPSKPFVSGEFFTTKDKSYEFLTEMFNGKPVQVNSRGQFKSLLKKHNMADASIKECRQEANFRKRINTEEHRNKIKDFARELFLKKRKELTFRRENDRRN